MPNIVDESCIMKRKASEDLESIDEFKKQKQITYQRKRMCAIMMMYSGVGYFGMQRNEGFKTIEGDILQAMYDAELIDDEDFKQPMKIKFQRASKTDKNVSALGQVCSVKLSKFNDVVDILNDKLPSQIRILDVFQTTKSFHAKGMVKYRTYRYITPSFAFSAKDISEDELINFRFNINTFDRVNQVLSYYKGTHNFHNFTSGRLPTDSSCRRYLMNLTCESAFEEGGVEYVSIVIDGQSFMLHQIRKMIGLTMAIVRGYCDETIFEKIFQLRKIDIPKAPGLGLILDKVNYESYNTKYAVEGGRKPIDWLSYNIQIKEFREKFVYSYIFKIENEESSMKEWLKTLSLHSYDFRETVNDSNSNDTHK